MVLTLGRDKAPLRGPRPIKPPALPEDTYTRGTLSHRSKSITGRDPVNFCRADHRFDKKAFVTSCFEMSTLILEARQQECCPVGWTLRVLLA